METQDNLYFPCPIPVVFQGRINKYVPIAGRSPSRHTKACRFLPPLLLPLPSPSLLLTFLLFPSPPLPSRGAVALMGTDFG